MDYNLYVQNICQDAKEASRVVATLSTVKKNNLLLNIAFKLRDNIEFILDENEKDLQEARNNNLSKAFYDRLLLTKNRIEDMAQSIETIASLADPIGSVRDMKAQPSGIHVGKMRVPVGVVAVIFESRPNVTTDIAALCIKSGNSSILRGGKEALYSNTALYSLIQEVLKENDFPEGIVKMVEKTDRELVSSLLKMDQYIDMVIPRGGEGLIKMVSRESTIPVLKHDKGLCHLFIDKSAKEEMANQISHNSKVQRPGVCNAIETILIHKDYPNKSSLIDILLNSGVEIRGCLETQKISSEVKKVTDLDWDTEYLDLIVSVKIVENLDEAVTHIRRFSSGHSEAIVTSDYENSEKFLNTVDSAAVFVNASTRFHDGSEFGLGAEVGISTQKLHARGAMGIEGLTTEKYIVRGHGEIR